MVAKFESFGQQYIYLIMICFNVPYFALHYAVLLISLPGHVQPYLAFNYDHKACQVRRIRLWNAFMYFRFQWLIYTGRNWSLIFYSGNTSLRSISNFNVIVLMHVLATNNSDWLNRKKDSLQVRNGAKVQVNTAHFFKRKFVSYL